MYVRGYTLPTWTIQLYYINTCTCLEGGNYSQSAAMVRMSRSILSEMSVGYAYQHRFLISLQILSGMEARGLDIDLEVSKKIMKIFLQCAKVSEEGCRHMCACMYVCITFGTNVCKHGYKELVFQ